MTPAYDVAQFIADNIVGFVLGTNVQVNQEQTPVRTGVSALHLNVTDVLGSDAEPFVDGGERTRLERASVNLFLRGDKDDPATHRGLAALLAEVLEMSAVGPWTEARVVGSGILPLGLDDNGFPTTSINLRLTGCFEPFPFFHGAAPVPGLIDAAWLESTLAQAPRVRRVLTYSAVAGAGDRLWAGFPQALSGTAAAPFRLFDGLSSKTPIATALLAGSVPVLVRGKTVLYDVHASAAAVAAGAHIAKVL